MATQTPEDGAPLFESAANGVNDLAERIGGQDSGESIERRVDAFGFAVRSGVVLDAYLDGAGFDGNGFQFLER
jgi:hypothetical protein